MSNGKPWRVQDAARNAKRARSESLRPATSGRNDPLEKNWKHVYTSSAKVKRARQLGFDYPRKPQDHGESDG